MEKNDTNSSDKYDPIYKSTFKPFFVLRLRNYPKFFATLGRPARIQSLKTFIYLSRRSIEKKHS
jgi:hypothetical protein